jgi:hypothetical protein
MNFLSLPRARQGTSIRSQVARFLAAPGYPDKIRWLVRDHVVVETAEANVSSRMTTRLSLVEVMPESA